MSETAAKKKLMILALNTHHLVQVEKYLGRREFEIIVNADIKSFIVTAMQWQPDFILLPVDHSMPTVRQLPKLLPQVMSSFIILYASQNTTASLMLLKKSGNAYNIAPPMTGPKVERTINKYYMDLANPEKAEAIKRASTQNNDSLMIKIEGGSDGDIKKFSADQKTKMVLEAITGGASTDSYDSTGPAYMPEGASDNSVRPNQTNNHSISVTGPTGSQNSQQQTSVTGSVPLETTPSHGSLGLEDDLGKTGAEGTPLQLKVAALADPHGKVPVEPAAAEERKRVLPVEVRDSISKSFESTLDFLNPNAGSEKVLRLISKVTSASCFSLSCLNFKGYAIVVSARDNHKHPTLAEIVKSRLNEYFTSQNMQIDTFGTINIQEVEFQPWAISQAEVLEQSHFKGEEFAIAFFPFENIEPLFQPTDAKDMLALHMDELHGDVKTEFDLYLRLVKNGKFLLYTPKNGVFLQEQRDRLILNGVIEMYLHPDDKKFVYRYRAQNFLNKEIDRFFEYVETRKKRQAS